MASEIAIKDGQEFFTASSLKNICINYCVTHANTLLLSPSEDKTPKLRKSVNLPNDLWEKLLQNFDSLSPEYPGLIHAVHHKFPILRKVSVRNSIHLKDDELRLIMENFPTSLDIHNCPSLTKKSMDTINELGKNLEILCLGTTTQIIPSNIDNWLSNHKEEAERGLQKLAKSLSRLFKGKSSETENVDNEPHGLLNTPKLRKLIIWGHHIVQAQQVRRSLYHRKSTEAITNHPVETRGLSRINVDYWEYLTRDFIRNLEYLDLSSCQEITDLAFLLEARNSLKFLYLHDVLLDYDKKTWGVLRNFPKLKFLDVSQYNELASVFANPDIILDKLVSSLPELVGLDISGTNLAGSGTLHSIFTSQFRFGPNAATIALDNCCIVGLASRKYKPLHFLGLLSTHYDASTRNNIPAANIAGGNSVDQLLLALKQYMYRDNILRKAVRILHEKLLRSNSSEFLPCYTILDLLLNVMSTHIEDKHTIILSMAAVFHVLKKIVTRSPQASLCRHRSNQAFNAVIRAMEIHSQDMSLLRNGVLDLLLLVSHMDLYEFHAEKLVPVLLKAGNVAAQNGFTDADLFLVKAISHILYTVTHFEEGNIMGKLLEIGVSDQLCDFMGSLFKRGILDQMPTFWVLLLKFFSANKGNNVGGHYNRFASSRYVDLCFKLIKTCYEEHGEFDEFHDLRSLRAIQKPVLAFLSNLLYHAPSAEAIVLKSPIVNLVFGLLSKNTEGNHELLHVACGFLCQVVSKKGSYEISCPSRQEIQTEILRTMESMRLTDKFSFTFKNLDQLYDLLKVQDAPEVHVWALWTLVKLTQSDKSFREMITRGKLDLNKLQQEYSGAGEYPCFQRLENLCRRLSSLIADFDN